jgi:AraC family transcriptional regulator, regulatory protein of adaptative response / methylated-DNA-[protein]-cysteine methyltransferase
MNAISNMETVMAAKASNNRDYARMAAAIAFIIARREQAPALETIADHVGLSPFHFQRLFKRWAGVSPKQFMGYLTVEHAKTVLERSTPVLHTAFDVGLSSSSRLHDLFVNVHGMTPGEYKAQGRDLVIRHGVHFTAFGPALVLTTERGVCGMEFIEPGKEAAALKAAKEHWPLSTFVRDDKATARQRAGRHETASARHQLSAPGLVGAAARAIWRDCQLRRHR